MSASSPDSFFKPLLAAYADCELDESTRQRVEQWLSAHPEALQELRAQQEFAPSNGPLWEAVEPVQPGAGHWATVRERIAREVASAPRVKSHATRRFGWLRGIIAAGGAAAAVAWLAIALTAPNPQPDRPAAGAQASAPHSSAELAPAPRTLNNPIGDYAVIPLAAEEDVVLDRVPDLQGGWLPIGQHPVPGVLTLATEDDVLLEDVSPNPAWPVDAGPRMTMTPGDAPMIYAAKSR
jgi:anti-sigma factor RsiW